MIYFCFDTNVYIKLLLDNYKKESYFTNIDEDINSIIYEVQSLINSAYFRLLLPEVIELEIEKENSQIKKSISGNCNKIIELLDSGSKCIWNEINDLIDFVKNDTRTYEIKKTSIWEKCFKQLEEMFKSDGVLKINLTSETICKTEKRRIKGLITEKQTNDSYIIDSLNHFMIQNIDLFFDEVYFITYDKGFWGKEDINGKFESDLKINLLFGLEQFEKKINLNFSFYDNESYQQIMSHSNEPSETFDMTDEWFLEMAQQDKENNEKLAANIEKQIVKQPQSVQSIRTELLESITSILNDCRKLENWDDRSELKLWQWLECRSEDEIPLSSVSDLCNILKSIEGYYKIHSEM